MLGFLTLCSVTECKNQSLWQQAPAPSKASSPHSAILWFHFQIPVSSLFLNIIPWLLKSSSSSFRPFNLSFNNVFYKAVPRQNGIQLAFHHFIWRRIFFSSLTLCNNSWFFILSFQLIFSILHKQQTSTFSRYFWSIFRSAQKSLL